MPTPPKSDQLKLITGTFRPDRARPSVQGACKPPDCPDWLDGEAATHFRTTIEKLQNLGVALDPLDQDALASYAALFVQFRRDPAGFPASRFGLLARVWERFGMTAGARATLGIAAKPREKSNPFADL